MPRSFSGGGGGWNRRPEAKLFSVPQAHLGGAPVEKNYDFSNCTLEGGVLNDSELQAFVENLVNSEPKMSADDLRELHTPAPADASAPSAEDPMMTDGAAESARTEEQYSSRISTASTLDPISPGMFTSTEPMNIQSGCFGLGLALPPLASPGSLAEAAPAHPPTPSVGCGEMIVDQIRTNTPLPLAKAPWEDGYIAVEAKMIESGPAAAPTPTPAPAPAGPADPDMPSFQWSECGSLIGCDALGVPLRVPPAAAWPAVQLAVQLETPLLYWRERRRWMWHKKWTMPKLRATVSLNGTPLDAVLHGGAPPLSVIVSAGTLRDDGRSMADPGLMGDCQRQLVRGEAAFSSLFFKHTSFNCGNRPFHIVATVLAPAHHPLAIAALEQQRAAAAAQAAQAAAVAGGDPAAFGFMEPPQGMVALACVCSSPIMVDARKRTNGERPHAAADDVRVMQRPHGAGAGGAGASPPGAGGAGGSPRVPPQHGGIGQQVQMLAAGGVPGGGPPKSFQQQQMQQQMMRLMQQQQQQQLMQQQQQQQLMKQHLLQQQLLQQQQQQQHVQSNGLAKSMVPVPGGLPGVPNLMPPNPPPLIAPGQDAASPMQLPGQAQPPQQPAAAAAAGASAAGLNLWPQEGPIELAGDMCLVKRVLSPSAFGCPSNELIGVSVLALLHPDDQLAFLQTARALLGGARSGVVSGTMRMFFRDARGKPELATVEMSLAVLRTPMQDVPATLLMSTRRVV